MRLSSCSTLIFTLTFTLILILALVLAITLTLSVSSTNRHPHIAEVYGLGHDLEHLFVVMEYFPKNDLFGTP